MISIVIFMSRQLVAERLLKKLRDALDVQLFYESDYSGALNLVIRNNPDVVVMEVAESGEYDIAYCLSLCSKLHASSRSLLLLCSEQDENTVAAAVRAKQQKLIKDFVFFDASLDYLVSKILTL
jgi:DNA-binding NarL/FixJ family response regulator